MTSRPRFLSRRALIRLAAATPASALVIGLAGERAIANGAEKVTTSSADLDKLVKLAKHLFKQFLTGVDHWRQLNPGKSITVEPEVFEKGMDLSGEVVAGNLSCFPPPGDLDGAPDSVHPTRRCAVACGYTAAGIADLKNGGKIDAAVFEAAWCATRTAFGVMKCAANPNPPTHTCPKTESVLLPESLKPKKGILAYGCG